MVRRVLFALVFLLLAGLVAGAWWWWQKPPTPKGEAYACLENIPLWSGVGQVRQPIGHLSWGEQVTLLDRYEEYVEIRTPKGVVGWVRERRLMTPNTWQKTGLLAARVRQMSAQSSGQTAVLSNLRLDPGVGSPRIGELMPRTPVEILARGVAAARAGATGAGAPRKQDWLLVRARPDQGIQMAGWVLAEFINIHLPGTLPAYTSSEGLEPIACFPLRSVNDPAFGREPYYLVAGSNGPEGSACDFTMLRVYTWSVPHQRYETAFVQNNLCGKLPIDVSVPSNPQRDVTFQFQNLAPLGSQTLAYRMHSTMVRALPAQTGTTATADLAR